MGKDLLALARQEELIQSQVKPGACGTTEDLGDVGLDLNCCRSSQSWFSQLLQWEVRDSPNMRKGFDRGQPKE